MQDLTAYLWQLVRGEVEESAEAAKNLELIRIEAQVRSYEASNGKHTRDEPWGDYADQIRATITSPDFATRTFLLALVDCMDTAQELRMKLWREEHARQNAISDRILARLTPESSEDERAKVWNRLRKVICASNDPKNVSEQLQSQLLTSQVEAGIVFSCLREELLCIADKLHEWIGQDGKKQRRLAEALERLGPAANEFLLDLMAALDRAEAHRFTFTGALASVARDDEPTVRSLVERVQLSKGAGATNPLQVLRELGTRAAELVPAIFPVLLEALEHSESRNAAIYALGAIGSGNAEWGERIARSLLELSRTDDVWQKGATIWALGDLKACPNLVVPRLIEAFDDYEEPDPDYCYGSAHTFVTDALAAFGPHAASGTPALLARLRDSDGSVDQGVLKALAAIGPVAAEFGALEQLQELAEQWVEQCAEENEFTVQDVIDDEENNIGAAIRSIRGD
ncbi:hypothetical protein EON83_05565 [bacterium]|nr:MAG: hypothetical protein EON83_05565 [bacterium]